MDVTTTEQWGQFAPTPLQAWAIEQSNARPKSLFGSFCRRLVLTGLQAPLDVDLWGARFRLYPTDNLCEKRALLSLSQFDVAERQALSQAMHENFRFVDVGANVGLYSLFVAATAGPLAKVLAIEPQPVIKQRLKFNLLANPKANVTHVDCAVSDKKGMSRMSISTTNRGASGFSLRDRSAGDDVFVVQTNTLAEVLSKHDMNGADALKMDIEGAEDQVLPIFFDSTNSNDLPKLLILERNDAWAVDCIALAKKCGYRQIVQAHMNVVLER